LLASIRSPSIQPHLADPDAGKPERCRAVKAADPEHCHLGLVQSPLAFRRGRIAAYIAEVAELAVETRQLSRGHEVVVGRVLDHPQLAELRDQVADFLLLEPLQGRTIPAIRRKVYETKVTGSNPVRRVAVHPFSFAGLNYG
jgi:hypothetical protein